jgi:replicative DNA helicase
MITLKIQEKTNQMANYSDKSKWKKPKEFDIENELPPNSQELEDIVLGTILIASEIIHQIAEHLKLELFFSHKNKLIAETIIKLYNNNNAIDLVSVSNELRNNNKLEEIGGAYHLSLLTNRIASTSNIENHIYLLKQYSLQRNLIQICGQGIQKSFDSSYDIFDVFAETQLNLESSLKNLVKNDSVKVGVVHNQLIYKAIDIANKGIKSGIPTGLTRIDNVTNGWQKSDLIILAGRPSMGKTAVAVCMSMIPAIHNNIPIAIFSLEMSNEQLVSRMQSYLSEINVSKIVKKQLELHEIEKMENTTKALNNAPLYIDDTPNISLTELKSKARRLVRENKVELIIIDYLQLMRSGLPVNNREQEIAEISKGLKSLAKELDIPVIALSQLSRGVESRADKKPMLSDLRESGQIEQDADMVIFCYRPEYYGIDEYIVSDTAFNSDGLMMLIISKHRNGELGEIPLRFLHEFTKIINYDDDYSTNSSNLVPPINNVITENKMMPNTNFDKHLDNQEDKDLF